MSDAQTTASDVPEVTILHNPSCSHSRGALGILQEQAVDHSVIEYLRAPPSRETLEMIVSKLINPVPELIRTTDKKFVELGLDPTAYNTADEVIEFLLVHPELMQRPIVIKGSRAVIARPSERVAEVFGNRISDRLLGQAVASSVPQEDLMIIIYVGTITMDPDVRDRYIALRLEQTRSYRAQPGVLGYAITADAVDPSVVNVFECYESEDALAAHQAIHERNVEIPVQSYALYRYDATRAPLLVS